MHTSEWPTVADRRIVEGMIEEAPPKTPAGCEWLRVEVAPRQNSDARAYKVLMSAVGDSRHLAITPDELRLVARLLGSTLATRQPDYLVGMAPGGLPIAVALAFELDLRLVVAYKTRLGIAQEVTWEEPHCFNSTFYVYGLEPGTTVLLVDDEIDSGDTLCNAAVALDAAGVSVLGAMTVVETLHAGESRGRTEIKALGLPLTSLRTVDVADYDGIGPRSSLGDNSEPSR